MARRLPALGTARSSTCARGAALTMPATKPTGSHEVKIEGDDVLVKLSD